MFAISQHYRLALLLSAAPLLLFHKASCAEDRDNLDELILRLGDEKFDAREAATEQLGSYPAGYARVFLKLSSAVHDLEIRDRLNAAARKVFERRIGARDDRWLRMHGTLGITGQLYFTADEPRNGERALLGLVIGWVDVCGPSEGRLESWDVIVSADGAAAGGDLMERIKAGAEYQLSVRRYKNIEGIRAHGFSPSDKDYQTFSVKVRAAWKEKTQVNRDEAAELMETMWREFLQDFRNPDSRSLAEGK